MNDEGEGMLDTVKKVIREPVKIVFGLERMGLLDWIREDTYLKLIYRLIFKRKLNLEEPKAFTEKLNWYKLHWRSPLAAQCADKAAVREYVAEKIGPEYLIDQYGCWDSFDKIDFDSLPDSFILKPTNGSGDAVICRDKHSLDRKEARKTLEKYRRRHFSSWTKEWAYYGLPDRILAERLLKPTYGNAVRDYKFFCFQGEPRFFLVGSDRDTDVKFSYFDMDFNPLPVRCGHDFRSGIEKPAHFQEMVEVARRLSEDFHHVRVDLYEEEDRVYFGELTFYHYGGITRFEPDKWDYIFGEYFQLSQIPKDEIV